MFLTPEEIEKISNNLTEEQYLIRKKNLIDIINKSLSKDQEIWILKHELDIFQKENMGKDLFRKGWNHEIVSTFIKGITKIKFSKKEQI